MKRIQLFEFEDFRWFPSTIRAGMTNLIVVLHKMLGTSEVLANLLTSIRQKYPFEQIVDLGSGSGGAMPAVVERLNEGDTAIKTSLILTDLYPNPDFIAAVNAGKYPHTSYLDTPVDARNLSNAPKGLKTMVNIFHHLPPPQARQILQSAQDQKQPILIYEMAENFVPTLLWWLLLPLSLVILIVMALVMTPFSRPLTVKQLIFTYLIPIIPLCYAWDGQASSVRIYTFKDIDELMEDIESEDYTWEVAHAKKKDGKKLGYYILGLPK